MYSNKNYKVELLSQADEEGNNYQVVNRITEAVEAYAATLPQACTYAAQFHLILENKMYERWAQDVAGQEEGYVSEVVDFPTNH